MDVFPGRSADQVLSYAVTTHGAHDQPNLAWYAAVMARGVFLAAGILISLQRSMTPDLNTCVRHVLPVYPFAAVLAGAFAWTTAKSLRAEIYFVSAML